MARKILIDAAHKEETRVVVVDGKKVEEFDFETRSRKQIFGNIYLARIARIEPALQAVFVEFGGDRHGFLPFSEIHSDYYQIPVADKEKLEAEIAPSASHDAPFNDNASAADSAANAEISGMQLYDPPPLDEEEPPIVGFGDIEHLEGEPAKASEDADSAHVDDEVVSEPDGRDDVDADDTTLNGGELVEQEVAGHDATPDDAETMARAEVREQIRKRGPLQRSYKVQEVIRPRQILLVQAIKEARGSKGASLSTYISLAGRYCVLMPNTARGGGISRKISSATDRKKLKLIAEGISVPEGAGLIIRTAGAKRTKQEIKRDYDYLLRQWDQIRLLTFKSIAPTPIYEEGGLIKRAIRDIYTKSIDTIIVEGDKGYRVAKDFMKLIMPSHAKKVQQYSGSHPLFSRYQIEGFLSDLFNPLVQLPSGGYLVIGITEALVAIDVNSGRATSHGTLEQTALHTNLEAAEEAARQIRLRDLAGIIVIDFIDMPERKNNAAVEKRLKENMKVDRARIQVGRITSFGLLELSRQRLRPGIMEAISAPCRECSGTGLVRSDESLVLTVLRQLETTGMRRLPGIIWARLPIRIANVILNEKRGAIIRIEQAFETTVRIEADTKITGTNFRIEVVRPPDEDEGHESEQVISIETSLQQKNIQEVDPQQKPDPPKRKRRKGSQTAAGQKRSRPPQNRTRPDETVDASAPTESDNLVGEEERVASIDETESDSETASRRRGRRSKPRQKSQVKTADPDPVVASASEVSAVEQTGPEVTVGNNEQGAARAPKPAKKTRRRRGRNAASVADAHDDIANAETAQKDPETETGASKRIKTSRVDDSERPKSDDVELTESLTGSPVEKKQGWWSTETKPAADDPDSSAVEGN